MFKQLRLIILAALLALTVGAAQAQDQETWSAWMFNLTTMQMVRVNSWDETQSEPVTVTLPDGMMLQRPPVSFGYDGNRFAACVTDASGTNFHVIIYDVPAAVTIMNHDLGQALACDVSAEAFNDDNNTQLTVGVFRHFEDDPAPEPAWELLVLDIGSGSIVSSLNPDLPPSGNAPSPSELGSIIPYVNYFSENVIAFRAIPYATDAMEAPGVVWGSGSLSYDVIDIYGRVSLHLLNSTGEALWIQQLDSLPPVTLEGLGVPANAVMVSNKNGERGAVFHQPGQVYHGATFIDGGRKIAFTYSDGTMGAIPHWEWVDRTGVTGELPGQLENVYELFGTSDGYVFLITDANGGATFVHHAYGGEGGEITPTSTDLWSSSDPNWQLVWVTSLQGASGLQPFPFVG